MSETWRHLTCGENKLPNTRSQEGLDASNMFDTGIPK